MSLISMVVLLAGACRADAPRRRIVTQVEAGDSAGVSRVRIANLGRLRLPEVRGRRVWSSESPELVAVRDAWIEPQGTVLVASAGTSAILRLDEEGRLTERFGSGGEGPGEFAELGLSWIDASRESGIAAYDERLRRLTVFDDEGQVVDTRPIRFEPHGGSIQPLAWAGEGRILAVREDRLEFEGEGIRRDSVSLLSLTIGGSADTLGVWPGREWLFGRSPDRVSRVPVGLAYDLLHDGAGTVAVVAPSEALDVRIFQEGALRSAVFGEASPRTVGSDEARRVREDLSDRAPNGRREVWREAPVNDVYPILDAVVVVQDGKVWLGLQPGVGEETREFVILERSGIPVGRLSLPRELEVLAATSTHFVARRPDEADADRIELWRID